MHWYRACVSCRNALVEPSSNDNLAFVYTSFLYLLACAHQSAVCRILSEWLETKFGGGQDPSDGTLRTIHFTNTIQEKEQSLHRVYISIKVRWHVQSWPTHLQKKKNIRRLCMTHGRLRWTETGKLNVRQRELRVFLDSECNPQISAVHWWTILGFSFP